MFHDLSRPSEFGKDSEQRACGFSPNSNDHKVKSKRNSSIISIVCSELFFLSITGESNEFKPETFP